MTTGEKIATVVAVATVLQFIALVVTIWIQRSTAKRQSRAYVFPDNINIWDGTTVKPPDLSKTNIPLINMLIKNLGQTPAYDVRSVAMLKIIEPDNIRNVKLPALTGASLNNIGPNGAISKNFWFDRALTPNEIVDVSSGAKHIYLIGRIEYRDAFKQKRFTNFRMSYNGNFPAPVMLFTFSESGNESN